MGQSLVFPLNKWCAKFQISATFCSHVIVFAKPKFLFCENRVLKLHDDFFAIKRKLSSLIETRNQKFTWNLKERAVHNRRKLIPPFTKEPNKERRARTRSMNAWPRPYFYLCCYKDWSLVVFRSRSIAYKPSIYKVKYFFVSIKTKLEFAKIQHFHYGSHLNCTLHF